MNPGICFYIAIYLQVIVQWVGDVTQAANSD